MELFEELGDAILALEELVVDEFEGGDALQAQASAELTPKKGGRPCQRAG